MRVRIGFAVLGILSLTSCVFTSSKPPAPLSVQAYLEQCLDYPFNRQLDPCDLLILKP